MAEDRTPLYVVHEETVIILFLQKNVKFGNYIDPEAPENPETPEEPEVKPDENGVILPAEFKGLEINHRLLHSACGGNKEIAQINNQYKHTAI